MVKFLAPPHPHPRPLAAPKPKVKTGPRPRILRFKPFPFPLLRGWRISRLKSPPFPIRSHPCILSILRFIRRPRCFWSHPTCPGAPKRSGSDPLSASGERVRVRWLLPRSTIQPWKVKAQNPLWRTTARVTAREAARVKHAKSTGKMQVRTGSRVK